MENKKAFDELVKSMESLKGTAELHEIDMFSYLVIDGRFESITNQNIMEIIYCIAAHLTAYIASAFDKEVREEKVEIVISKMADYMREFSRMEQEWR